MRHFTPEEKPLRANTFCGRLDDGLQHPFQKFKKAHAENAGMPIYCGTREIGPTARWVYRSPSFDACEFVYMKGDFLWVVTVDAYRRKSKTKNGKRTDTGVCYGTVHSYGADGTHKWSSGFRVDYTATIYNAIIQASKTRNNHETGHRPT